MHAATVVNCVGNITEMMYDQDDIKVTFTHQYGLTQTFFGQTEETFVVSRQKTSCLLSIVAPLQVETTPSVIQ